MAFDPASKHILSFLFHRQTGNSRRYVNEHELLFRSSFPKLYEKYKEIERLTGHSIEDWAAQQVLTNDRGFSLDGGYFTEDFKNLFIAVRAGDFDAFQQIMTRITQDETVQSPLEYLDREDHAENICILACAGSQHSQEMCDEIYNQLIVPACGPNLRELLSWAVRAHQPVAKIHALCEFIQDLSASDQDGYYLPALACEFGHLEALKYFLIDRGMHEEINAFHSTRPFRRTLLCIASAAGHADIVSYLIARGARTANVLNCDELPFYQACRGGHLAVVQLLVENGVLEEDKNSPAYKRANNREVPLLWSVCINKDFKLAQYLIDHGFSEVIDALVGRPLRTALSFAANAQASVAIKFLLMNGADITLVVKKHDRANVIEALRNMCESDGSRFIDFIRNMLEKFISRKPERYKLMDAQHFLDALNRGDQDAKIDGIYGEIYAMCKPLLNQAVQSIASPRK